jgi:hypothetical protein
MGNLGNLGVILLSAGAILTLIAAIRYLNRESGWSRARGLAFGSAVAVMGLEEFLVNTILYRQDDFHHGIRILAGVVYLVAGTLFINRSRMRDAKAE